MLIVISDLHFNDETTSLNVSHRAFSHFFNYIKGSMRNEYKELVIVFAGDTFDLLRSDYWINVDEKEKPWNVPSMEQGVWSKENKSYYQKHLKQILNNIIKTNRTSLNIIKQAEELFSVPVTKIMVPGNHDRMLKEIEDYQTMLSNTIGPIMIVDGAYENQDYGVTIRHGHEFDAYNFENGGIPIGDVNAVELFVRLPFFIKGQLPELADELKSIEDIRPQWRIFDYLHTTYTDHEVKYVIEKSIGATIDYFFSLPYVKQWIAKHDTYHPFDEADKLQYLLYLSRLTPVGWMEKLLKVFSYFEMKESHYEEMAEKEASLYVVYGHTHKEHVAFLGFHNNLHRYYINTGTWRERVLASNKGFFTCYKTMTYAIFYKKEERLTEFPAFEIWNGALRE